MHRELPSGTAMSQRLRGALWSMERHGVTEDLPTVAEFHEQLEAIRNRLRR